ncbi:MAG TPA: DUF2911 domain-containing protein [Thermoanaerobaculia bacterium]|jgi:hypothetical protein|nr:DUF2911 domain-containing protein [Thermoanaerobaculia bacterium]
MQRRILGAATALLIGVTASAVAQDRKPLSPPGHSSAMVEGKWSAPDKDGNRKYDGGKWIEIDYSRPMLRGRTDIFGKGATYGKDISDSTPVWRAGANQTTKLTTEVPLMIGGKKLEPGSYDLFIDLKQPAWSLVVSTQPTQEKYDANDKTKIWGAYGYDPKFDVVRTPMTMVTPRATIEQWTINFIDMTDAGGKIVFGWDKTEAVVPFTVAK